MSPYSYNYWDFQRFLLFRNKARNAGRSRKNAGMRERSQNAGFPARLREGWHLCYEELYYCSLGNLNLIIKGLLLTSRRAYKLTNFQHNLFNLMLYLLLICYVPYIWKCVRVGINDWLIDWSIDRSIDRLFGGYFYFSWFSGSTYTCKLQHHNVDGAETWKSCRTPGTAHWR